VPLPMDEILQVLAPFDTHPCYFSSIAKLGVGKTKAVRPQDLTPVAHPLCESEEELCV